MIKSFNIPKDLCKKMDEMKAKTGVSLSYWITKIIEEALKGDE